ncbi:hypothetical protein BGZ80_004515 [Entomortierella chlamydospora]|uniref:Aminotransferase class V domain-containing protein n=1 Tax=Entomortierella chlamydospora TaxID=101097 RepID=A0A9P6SVZ9_9FUNG|nr:hypothetical protein BGZ79_010722 [Entomortierella chlamydospora]KAG0007556.1 hypothetical protein BGZ80_004515 [Entomortierella chlamydospora]
MSVKIARETIRRCTNATNTPGHEHQAAVIFSGDGSTSAVNKVRNVFRLGDEAYWTRKSIADTQASKSHLDVLESQLILHQHRPLKLGTFSAGSNLTGVLNDTVAISELLHKYNAFAFFDYAGVGPYTTIDMNPAPSSNQIRNLAYKDGVFISTHKFLGGPGASGVLVARFEIFDWTEKHSGTNRNDYVPAAPGGGTVDMVIQGKHKYTNNVLAREEAGTPNILATIRTGLVFRLQEIMDPAWILQKEYKLARNILGRLTAPGMEKSIHILGASERDRVAVFSLTIAVPRMLSRDKERPLQIHYTLLSTLMNDFFGIEMRGGCMCAGPYASQLLKFDADKEAAFWRLLMGYDKDPNSDNNRPCTNIHQMDLHSKSLKPGFVRFSFSYFAKDKDVEFVVQSLEWMAQFGYLLIPLYKLDARTGEWTIREAVRKAVLSGIPSKRMTTGQRKHCIPVAIHCIYGLQKLFQEQSKSRRQQSIPPISQPLDLNLKGYPDSGQENSRSQIFFAPHQAPRDPSNTAPRRPENSESSIALHNDLEHDNLLRVPNMLHNVSSSDVSSIISSTSEYTVDLNQRRMGSTAISLPSSPSATTIHTPNSTSNILKKSGLFLTSFLTSPKDQRLLDDALKELSMDSLRAEINAVECSELAKELRWFVSPLDVALLYTQELANPSQTSPFPHMN